MLCRDYFQVPQGVTFGAGKISFNLKEDPPLYILMDGVFIRCGLECEFEWTNEVIEKPVSVLSYEQNEHGVLAWVAEIIHDSPKGRVLFRMPLIKSGENYLVRTIYTEMPKDVQFIFGIEPPQPTSSH